MKFKNYIAAYILIGENRKLLYKLIPLGIFNIVIDMLSFGLVIPFFSIILSRESSDNYFLKLIYKLDPELRLHDQANLANYMMVGLVLIFIFKMIFVIYFNYRLYNLAARINNNLSEKLLLYYLNKDYIDFINDNSSNLQNTIISEVSQFVGIVQAFIIIIIEFLVLLTILFFLIYIDPLVAIIIILVSLFIVYLASKHSSRFIMQMGFERQIFSGKRIQIINETFSLFKEIKLYEIYSYFVEKFNITNFKINEIGNRQNTYQQIPRLTLEVLAISVLCLMVSYYLLDKREPDFILSLIAVYALSVFRVLPSISRIINSLQLVSYSTSSIQIIYNSIKNIPVKISSEKYIKEFKELLTLNNVSFSILDKKILSNINIEIKKNLCIGFYGESGSGKTTLGNILAGLIDIGGGEILLDGDIVSLKNSNWKSMVGYVQQDYYLIDSTILENIALGCNDESIDYLRVEKSLAQAGLLSTISNMKDGLFTYVGERGVNLSGGQRQRLIIARALYRNPKLLILDEATSALDPISRSIIIETINSLRGKVTIVIISHDPELIHSCDYTYIIESGKIKNEYDKNIVFKNQSNF